MYTPMPGRRQRVNTWCGSIIEDVAAPGVWHGFFTSMLGNCPVVDAFYQNGQVLHATAVSPLGPFEGATVAVPNWATQPEISYDPATKTYVLLHSRYDGMAARTRGNQSALPCDVDGRAAGPPVGFHCAAGPCPKAAFPSGRLMEGNVTLAFASSPAGPWTDRIDVHLDRSMSNPSMMVHANGTAVLVWRGSNGFCTAMAKSIRGPYTQVNTADFSLVDPHIFWVDSPPSYHVISLEGGHAFTSHLENGWTRAPAPPQARSAGHGPAYSFTVNYSATESHAYGTRECPVVVQSAVGGKPLWLVSVLQRLNSNLCGNCSSTTVVQKIK
eukprot:SAG22_NODE_1236_length_5055_cov_12.649593_2_plen_327_part_00